MIDPLPSDLFSAGQVLNNTYEILGVLGRGGTGEVYKARNQITNRVVAIKALSAEHSGHAGYLDLMTREEEMRDILHDAVVRYYECTRTETGHVILVMDFIDGPSLADEMMTRQLDPRELLIIAHRIAAGLGAAHARGIVHRDLSPDNIILRKGLPEQATLIDFGIAKDTAAEARTIVGKTFAGKYEFAAPEQLDGEAEARSDLYGLGATLLAAYRGEIPYLGTTPGEIYRRKQAPLDHEDVPEPLRGLIAALTAVPVENRPATAAEVIRMVDANLKPLTRVQHRNRSDTSRSRQRTPTIIYAGILTVLVLVSAGYLWRDAIFGPVVPPLSPYTLSAADVGGGGAKIDGNAPDGEARALLSAVFQEATGVAPAEGDIRLAPGAPPQWAPSIAELIGLLAVLDTWTLNVSDLDVEVTGIAQDKTRMAAVDAELNTWNGSEGMTLTHSLQAGPERLSGLTVSETLRDVATCGALKPVGEAWRLGEEVTVRGDVETDGDRGRIEAALDPVIGSRILRLQLRVLNPQLCAVRNALPDVGSADLSVILGNADGSPNLSGVYHPGDALVAEVRAPSNATDGYLRVMTVEDTGEVFYLIPTGAEPEPRLSEIGSVEAGLRSIQIFEIPQSGTTTGFLATADEDMIGKSELIAIVSNAPIFARQRPREESITAFTEDLEDRLEDSGFEILGIASRIIDVRSN